MVVPKAHKDNVRFRFLVLPLVMLVSVACTGSRAGYQLGEVTLGMRLDEQRQKFPLLDLRSIQSKTGVALMMGRMTIAGFEESSLVLGQVGTDFVVVSVSTGSSRGPEWTQIRQDLERWNGSPDHTWKAANHESAVWGATSAPAYDGGISASSLERYCSGPCLVATYFDEWTEVQMLDVAFLGKAGL